MPKTSHARPAPAKPAAAPRRRDSGTTTPAFPTDDAPLNVVCPVADLPPKQPDAPLVQ